MSGSRFQSRAGDFSPLSLSKSASTTCASLLRELQELWDEIGESDNERDKMLLLLEQECLQIYRRKVECTRKCKSDLQHSFAESEAEIIGIASALGEQAPVLQVNGNLKQKLSLITPTLETLRLKKLDRVKEMSEVKLQIARISAEITSGDHRPDFNEIEVDERDLTNQKLGELKSQLQELTLEKNLRLQQVISCTSAIHELAMVMSLDFMKIMAEIDTSAHQSKSISNETLARLNTELNALMQEKQQRFLKVQNLGRSLVELWELINMPSERNHDYDYIANLTNSSVNEALRPGSLSTDVIKQIEAEVDRLTIVKSSKMKELIMKRQYELEGIYRSVHVDVDCEKARQLLISLIDSGNADLSELLSSMDSQISRAKEVAQSRKDILDKVGKWKNASVEETWLDEYERDENRYSAGRGFHKNLKRAEKARVLVSKIPSLVENLIAKVQAWEQERKMPFVYDQAPLLRALEDFTVARQEKEEEKRRIRGQKKLQDQLATEQEAIFGSKASTKRPLGQSPHANSIASTPYARHNNGKERRENTKMSNVTPINYVALSKQ